MHTTICKTFTFDAAHDLPYHDGKCQNLHGHTYRLDVYVSGEPHPISEDDPESGMVLDFGRIAEVWKRTIEPRVDHQYLNDWVTYPTAERLVSVLAAWFRQEGIPATRLRLYETPTAFAEVLLVDDEPLESA